MATETRYQELKRYVRFDERDARLLAAFRPVASPHFERIAQEFYDRIREHEGAHSVFTGEEQISRLQRSLVKWMHRVFSGTYDEAYFEETQKIGRIHVKVGLPQRYMFTAMALIRVSLVRIAEEAGGSECDELRDAILRVIDLELAIMLESYREDVISRVQRIERIEKQALNRTLQRTEHRYVNAVELARALIIGLDAAGDIRLFNREAERVTGFARDEVFGQPFIETLLQEDMITTRGAMFRRALEGAQLDRDVVDCGVRTRSGKYRDVRWHVAYAPSEADDEVTLFVIGNDVTDSNVLAERTRQNEKLAAVGTLAAGLAHEIRNPLNGAQLHVSFLERTLKKSGASVEMLDAVDVVSDEIKRLATLVSEFLDFARPRPPSRRPIAARVLVERAAQLVAPQAAQAKVDVTLDFPTQDLVINVDGPKMQQVLLNLMANAIESLAPVGGGHMTVRVRRQPRSVILEVQDDGPGLPSPDAPIFDPFFSTKAQGTGLGLAITHRIVADHGGDVSVDSQAGRTTFRVTLPFEPA